MLNENTNKQLWVWWVAAIVLLVCITALAIGSVYYWQQWQGRQVQAPLEQISQPAKPHAHADRRYVYAGNPRPTPAFPYQIHVLTNIGYVIGYCEERKDPVWVGYRLFKVASLQAPKRPDQFMVDDRTSARIVSADYSGSGYDRGHMAPNYAIAVCYGREAQLQTFLMSNIIPQRPNLNRRAWERLEQAEVKDFAHRFGMIWVTDGPVFHKGARRLNCGVLIPDACYKIIVEEDRGQPRMIAFLMPQDVDGTELPDRFLTSVAEIEKETGLDFFSELPKEVQDRLEATAAGIMW